MMREPLLPVTRNPTGIAGILFTLQKNDCL